MVDRAQYLARTLISRIGALERIKREDSDGGPSRQDRAQVVEKILAVDVGVTDWKIVSLIEAAIPENVSFDRPHDREIAALADFIRQHLARELAD